MLVETIDNRITDYIDSLKILDDMSGGSLFMVSGTEKFRQIHIIRNNKTYYIYKSTESKIENTYLVSKLKTGFNSTLEPIIETNDIDDLIERLKNLIEK